MVTITEQIIDLGHAAEWLHEIRNSRGEWTVVGNTAGVRKEIGKQLDKQGLDPQNPLRGVLQYNVVGNHSIVHRDPATGHIDAGINYTYQKHRTTQTHSISLHDVRSLRKGHGIGAEMIRQIVKAHPEAKDMAVHGAIESAKPFYAGTGASMSPTSSFGEWSPEAVKALRDAALAGDADSEDVTELGWRYNPLEHRNAHGEWSRGGADPDKVLSGMKWAAGGSVYRKPPADRQAKNGAKASDNPFIRKYGLSAEHVLAAYDASTPDERDQGMRWYSDAHDVANKIGGGDADKGAAMLSTFSPQTDWATDVMNAAHTLANKQVPEHGVGITGAVRSKAQAILAAENSDDVEKLFPEAGASKTQSFYHLIRNGGDTPGDQDGAVVIDRHALSVAAGRRLTGAETVAPTYDQIKEDHPDWTPEQAKAYKATFPADPTGSPYTYQHIADMYRDAAKAVSDRGTPVSPHQMQAITWLHQLNSNNAEDAKLIELGAEAVRAGRGMGTVPGATEAKGRASSIAKRWATWQAYADAHQVPVQHGTTALTADSISGQLDLARWEGWRTEPRDSHGRWTQGWTAGSLAKHMRADGTIDPERAALHKQIIDGILAGHQPSPHPVATFLGGGPASGKSSVLSGSNRDMVIAADDIKGQLPEYQEMAARGDLSAGAYVHPESTFVAKQVKGEAERRKISYTLDGTGDTSFTQMAAKVRAARAAGYAVNAKYVTVDPDEAVRRAKLRAAETGRMVPETAIRAEHTSVSDTFAEAADKRLFDNAELWDNNGRTPALAAEQHGGPMTVRDEAAYSRFLAKGERYARAPGAGRGGVSNASGDAAGSGVPAAGDTGHAGEPQPVGLAGGRPGSYEDSRDYTGHPLGSQPGLTIGAQLDLGWEGWRTEPRDSRGRWTRFGGVSEAVRVMEKEREGFSVSPRTGEAPQHGFMVALDGHTHRYPAEILDDPARLHKAIDDMLMSERDSFQGKDMYLGGWVEDGKLWLDPSQNVPDRATAEQLGKERDQVGIFDLDTFNTVSTGGSGGGRITDHQLANPSAQGARGGPRKLLGSAGGGTAGGGSENRGRDPGWPGAWFDFTRSVVVDPEALNDPGLPVPDDPDAVSMYSAHRLDRAMHELTHAVERMQEAQKASGKLRVYYTSNIARHVQNALDTMHYLMVNIQEHYPAEAAELEQLKQTLGLAKSVSDDAKIATTAHLLGSVLNELTHASRHVKAMLADTPDSKEWEFDAQHCARHLDGAVEHTGKLTVHFTDNYPAEARWLAGLKAITDAADSEPGPQHATGKLKTIISAQLAGDTITGQLDLAGSKAHDTAHNTASATARLHAQEAWRHERRNWHGEWGMGDRPGDTEDFASSIGKLRGNKNLPADLRDKMRQAQTALHQGDAPGAVNHLVDAVNDPRLDDTSKNEIQRIMRGIAAQPSDPRKAVLDNLAFIRQGIAGIAEGRAVDSAYTQLERGNKAAAIMNLQKAQSYAERLGIDDRVSAYYRAIKAIDALPDSGAPGGIPPHVADAVTWLLHDAAAHSRLSESSSLLDASDAIKNGHAKTAAQALLNAAEAADRDPDGGHSRAEQYRGLANQVSPGAVKPVPPEITAVKGFLDKTSASVPGMFGDNEAMAWDGREPGEFSQQSKPSLLADTDWTGHMRFSDEVAKHVQAALSSTGPVEDPDALTVPLHEMIHVVLPKDSFTPGQVHKDDLRAYQDPVTQAVEEGFTQLGTAQHAEEFFQKAGLADRKTMVMSPADTDSQEWKDAKTSVISTLAATNGHLFNLRPSDSRSAALDAIQRALTALGNYDNPYEVDNAAFALMKVIKGATLGKAAGDPETMRTLMDDVARLRERQFKLLNTSSAEHETMGEYARRMADPTLIRNGNSWPHYTDWTRDAYDFSATIAGLRGDASPAVIQAISDHVNAVGPAQKIQVMAQQTLRAAGIDAPSLPDSSYLEVLAGVEQTILSEWPKLSPQETVKKAVGAAKAQIQAMQETT